MKPLSSFSFYWDKALSPEFDPLWPGFCFLSQPHPVLLSPCLPIFNHCGLLSISVPQISKIFPNLGIYSRIFSTRKVLSFIFCQVGIKSSCRHQLNLRFFRSPVVFPSNLFFSFIAHHNLQLYIRWRLCLFNGLSSLLDWKLPRGRGHVGVIHLHAFGIIKMLFT